MYYMINEFGERIPAQVKRYKSSGIFHETLNGDWVKKVIAIREGWELTGNRKRLPVEGSTYLVPLKPKKHKLNH